MKNLLIIILLLSLVNCNRYASFEQSKEFKGIYISEFKLEYFKKLLLAAYNNSESIKGIINADASSYSEPVLSSGDIDVIDNLVKLDNAEMVTDSLNSYSMKGEGAQGKAVFIFALNKYNSRWLDSLAHKRYKIYKSEH